MPAFPSLIIVGGGLAGGLCALALAKVRPDLALALVEPGETIGGNHLWSFFDADLSFEGRTLVTPLVAHRWPGYSVRFPAHRRRLTEGYNSIESDRLDTAVRAALPASAIIRASATSLTPTSVTLDNGRTLVADAVLDTSGINVTPEGLACGWQKFVGQLLTVPTGHGLVEPVVMDATVDQAEGYRFVYCLPFTRTEVFVEDTYYSDTPDLDPGEIRRRIARYAEVQGWADASVTREEIGVLPVVIGGDFDRFWPAADPVARAGVRAGLFHPLTSYSLPDAVRFAHWLATEAPLDSTLGRATRTLARARWKRGKFDRLLARMLMRAADPPERYRVLERFYRLPAPLIARFYAGRSTLGDRMRILAGRPPVSIRRAMTALMDRP
jgi:lycopene beta-cyclase